MIVTVLAMAAVVGLSGCERAKVPAGNVGIKVDLYGGDKGVQNEKLGTGKYWLSWNEEVYLFPLFKQLHQYEQPFVFQTSDSSTVETRVGIEYRVMEDKVIDVFKTYRSGVQEITDNNIRQLIADSLINHGSYTTIDSLSAGGKATLLNNVTEDLKKQLSPVGIEIQKVSWLGKMDYPPEVVDAINKKNKAVQETQMRQNEVEKSKAEADKIIAEAYGLAESTKLKALAEAEAITLRGDALRKNPEVIQLEAVNKWNGVMPQYLGGDTPIPFISVDKNK
ncbi:SPFH/Band 7/PHB domain protein [Xenorhabdus bovienii]|nr:SPFH/Band 7/PHB domain protein [Xenorhabdus bovienii]MDE9494377.1 SPFH/Band 7/PHB domain protein [Xenorhabdus bovienii]MDE9502816.1 SPFH/Band 7/PHB domain protein [Xenorhabdus bovienii]MDE9526431.1 SPFH/Band 7/PHB domain protein [Xenorhabdus bovienii]MDE9568779.1 SPFH/Band 7/PHB domain protein [Xenorhabdus bovienii]